MRPLADLRAHVRADPALAFLCALVVANVVLVWSVPVLVGQDLPQHLSYARILADYADPRLAFQDNFVLPLHVQPYFTAYLILAPLTRLMSVLTACRVVYSAYVIAVAMAFVALVKAVHSRSSTAASPTPWTCLLGALLPWNPVQCVGFLPFMLSLPAVLFGVAALVRASSRGLRRGLVALVVGAAAATSLHFVAAISLVAFAWLFALTSANRRAVLAASVTTAATAVTVALWHTLGERGLEEIPVGALLTSIRVDGLHDALVGTLGVQWTSLATKWAFIVATVLGPLANGAKHAIGVAMFLLVAVVVATRMRRPAKEPAGSRSFLVAAVGFLLLVVLTPGAVRVPDDICLLDFRLYVVAFMLLVACIDPRWFEPTGARAGVAAFSLFVLAVWARQLDGAGQEATDVIHLVDRLEPSQSVLALPFHDRSAFLDEDNAVTHYFPVYYTAVRGGVTSLFWGKFSHHLPVGYRPGHEPQRPPDWAPADFTHAQLVASSHVLVEWPDADDGERRNAGAQRLAGELADGFTQVACEGRWCLFEPSRPLRESEEALR